MASVDVKHHAYLLTSSKFNTGAGRAQWVERPTEKPGAILTRVLVPVAARAVSLRVSFQCIIVGRMFVREPSWKYSANLAGS